MRLTIITHSLSRTGASKALLDSIVSDLSHKYSVINVLALAGGELLSDYEAVCNRVISPKTYKRISSTVYNWCYKRWLLFTVRYLLNLEPNETVLINTLVPLGFVNDKYLRSARVVVWAHELAQTARMYCSTDWHLALPRATYIASSEPVRVHLERHGLTVMRGTVLPISTDGIESYNVQERRYNYILGIGGPSWVKGTDYFLQVANKCKSRTHLKFVWIGGNVESFEYSAFKRDVSLLKLGNVLFEPSTRHMRPWYLSALGVLLLSREESFGLPIVEAGILGVPSIAWNNDDGPSWIINNTDGCIVPYGDIDEVCKLIDTLDERFRSEGNCLELRRKMIEFISTSQKLSDYLTAFESPR